MFESDVIHKIDQLSAKLDVLIHELARLKEHVDKGLSEVRHAMPKKETGNTWHL